MTLSIFKDAFKGRKSYSGVEMTRGSYYRSRSIKSDEITLVADVLDAIDKVVGALTDGRGGRFRTTLTTKTVGGAMAASTRSIAITSAPLLDGNLKSYEGAAVMCGLTVHEIGHARYSGVLDEALKSFPGDATAKIVGNLLEDVRLEKNLIRDYPGVGPSLRPANKYVAQKSGVTSRVIRWAKMPITDRMNFAITAVRYAPYARWIADEFTRAERAWWQEWAERYSASDSLGGLIEGIRAGLEHLRNPEFPPEPEKQPENQPPPPEEPVEEPEGDEDEDDSDDDEPESDDEDEGEDEDGDGDEGDSEGDKPEDDDWAKDPTIPDPDVPGDGDSDENGESESDEDDEDPTDDDDDAEDPTGEGNSEDDGPEQKLGDIDDPEGEPSEKSDAPGDYEPGEGGDPEGEGGTDSDFDEDDDDDIGDDFDEDLAKDLNADQPETESDEGEPSDAQAGITAEGSGDELGDGDDITDRDPNPHNTEPVEEVDEEAVLDTLDDYLDDHAEDSADDALAYEVEEERQTEKMNLGDGFGTMPIKYKEG